MLGVGAGGERSIREKGDICTSNTFNNNFFLSVSPCPLGLSRCAGNMHSKSQ